jgi:pimeloyl-ACP methyl ester carboxylesterase
MTHSIDVGDATIGHTRSGRGPDLVFLHGWPLHGGTFREIVPHLEASFTCHVLDLPGAGASTWSEHTSLRLEAQAERVLRAIDQLGLGRVGFVAHDSGGCIARLAAARLGDRCTAIVSGNTEIAAYRPPMLSALVAMRHVPGGAATFRALLGSRLFLRSPMGFGGAFDDLSRLEGEWAERFIRPLRDPRVFSGAWGLVRDFDWRTIDELERVHRAISAPVLFVWGKDDPWFPLARLRPTLAAFGGGARVVPIPGKVFAHEEHPRAFAELARDHLTTAASAAGSHPASQGPGFTAVSRPH